MATMSVPCFNVGLDCRPSGRCRTCTVCGWSECGSTPTHSCPEMVATPGASCAECLAHDDDDSDGVPIETDDETALPVELQTVRLDTRPTAELAREWAARLDSREAA